jgi:hypothetical protein
MPWHYVSGSYWNTQNIFSNSALSWFGQVWMKSSQVATLLMLLIYETVCNDLHKLWLVSCCSSMRLCGTNFTSCDSFLLLLFHGTVWHKLCSSPNIRRIWQTNSLMCSCSFINFIVIWCSLAINSHTVAAVSKFWAVNSHPRFESS